MMKDDLSDHHFFTHICSAYGFGTTELSIVCLRFWSVLLGDGEQDIGVLHKILLELSVPGARSFQYGASLWGNLFLLRVIYAVR